MKSKKAPAWAALLFLFLCAVYLTSLNFHEVEPGRFYRSAQLRRFEFATLLPIFKIKTVINLRGENPTAKWYEDEVNVARELGVDLITIDLNSHEIPSREKVLQLIDAYHSAKGPILVHCLGGADRSSMAAALYEMLIVGKSKDEALKMLSWRYHHLDSTRPAQRYFVNLVQSEEWLRRDYDPCSGQYQYFDVKGLCPSATQPK